MGAMTNNVRKLANFAGFYKYVSVLVLIYKMLTLFQGYTVRWGSRLLAPRRQKGSIHGYVRLQLGATRGQSGHCSTSHVLEDQRHRLDRRGSPIFRRDNGRRYSSISDGRHWSATGPSSRMINEFSVTAGLGNGQIGWALAYTLTKSVLSAASENTPVLCAVHCFRLLLGIVAPVRLPAAHLRDPIRAQ